MTSKACDNLLLTFIWLFRCLPASACAGTNLAELHWAASHSRRPDCVTLWNSQIKVNEIVKSQTRWVSFNIEEEAGHVPRLVVA